jgi:hypothetical protein
MSLSLDTLPQDVFFQIMKFLDIPIPLLLVNKSTHYLTKTIINPNKSHTLRSCIRVGSKKLLKWLIEYLRYPTAQICELAASEGQLDILKWAYIDMSYAFDKGKCSLAAIDNGRLNILKYLHGELGHELNEDDFAVAAEWGHVNILEWGFDKFDFCREEFFFDYYCSEAINQGQLCILDFYDSKSYRATSTEIGLAAVQASSIEALDWMYDHKWNLNTYHVECAVAIGDIDLLQWFHNHSFGISEVALARARKDNKEEVMRWLEETGYLHSLYSDN